MYENTISAFSFIPIESNASHGQRSFCCEMRNQEKWLRSFPTNFISSINIKVDNHRNYYLYIFLSSRCRRQIVDAEARARTSKINWFSQRWGHNMLIKMSLQDHSKGKLNQTACSETLSNRKLVVCNIRVLRNVGQHPQTLQSEK